LHGAPCSRTRCCPPSGHCCGPEPIGRSSRRCERRNSWEVLDMLNEISVTPGQVIYNANPEAASAGQVAPGRPVHALGNPRARRSSPWRSGARGPLFALGTTCAFRCGP
jgi:hypothetical protein